MILWTLGIVSAREPACTLQGDVGSSFGLYVDHVGGLTYVQSSEDSFVYDRAELCAGPAEVRDSTNSEFCYLHGDSASFNTTPGPTEFTLTDWTGSQFEASAVLSDPEILKATGAFALRRKSGDRFVAGAGYWPYPSSALFGVYVAPDWAREALIEIDPFSRGGSEPGIELSGWTLLHPMLGKVRMWTRQPGGAWPEDPVGLEEPELGVFGFAFDTAIWRDVIAIGVPYGPDFVSNERGLVVIYERNASGAWVRTADLLGDYSRFGYSVALWGNLLVVGAQGRPDYYEDGHVEVWRRTAAGWVFVDTWTTPDGDSLDSFGWRVELWGTVAVVPQTSSLRRSKVFVYEIPALDQDGDGFDEATDCADLDAEAFPGATERCNGLDDDCDESADEGCPDDPPEPEPTEPTDSGGPSTSTDDTEGPPKPRPDPDGGCRCGAPSVVPGPAWLLLLLGLRRRR